MFSSFINRSSVSFHSQPDDEGCDENLIEEYQCSVNQSQNNVVHPSGLKNSTLSKTYARCALNRSEKASLCAKQLANTDRDDSDDSDDDNDCILENSNNSGTLQMH